MDEQRKLQARNCISNYCFFPRSSATQLVDRMTQGEVERILSATNPTDKTNAEKKADIDKVLDACTKRWEAEANKAAIKVMDQQETMHTAGQVPDGHPTDQLDPADHLMQFILSDETLEELVILIADVDEETIDQVEQFALKLSEACDQVRLKRVDSADEPPADEDAEKASPGEPDPDPFGDEKKPAENPTEKLADPDASDSPEDHSEPEEKTDDDEPTQPDSGDTSDPEQESK